jgi:hypothetical protein
MRENSYIGYFFLFKKGLIIYGKIVK